MYDSGASFTGAPNGRLHVALPRPCAIYSTLSLGMAYFWREKKEPISLSASMEHVEWCFLQYSAVGHGIVWGEKSFISSIFGRR